MILEIEDIISIISIVFVLFSILTFIKQFYKNITVSIYRIKLSEKAIGLFIFRLSANVLLVIFYFFAAGMNNVKYGILGVIVYTLIFGTFFLGLSSIIKGSMTKGVAAC